MAGSLFAVCLLAQLLLCAAVSSDSLDVTRFFTFDANSTCGDSSSFVGSSCSLNQRNASMALDGDLGSWWQSEEGATSVEMAFSLQNTDLSLVVTGLRLYFLDPLPPTLTLEARSLGSQQYTTLQRYTSDGSCDPSDITCSSLTTVTVETNGNVNTLEIPVSFNEVVGVVRLVAEGFQPEQPEGPSLENEHYSLAEARVFADIAPGYFARSLHYIQAQGSDGVLTSTGERVPIGFNQTLFPGSRGHAELEFSDTELVTVQFVFPSIPKPGQYRLVIRYAQFSVSRRPFVMVTQGSVSVSTRVSLHVNCYQLPCYEPLLNSQNISEVAVFDLMEGPLTVQISLTSISVYIDSIIAIPEVFFIADTPELDQFDQTCNVTTGKFNTDTCIRGAQQLSLDCYRSTFMCNCDGFGAVEDSVCEAYGGQCPCVEPAEGLDGFLGRQCDLCPLYSYQTPDGCTSCECPDPLDMCALATGQCSSCPPLVVGRSCDMCVDNSFGDPLQGCQPCSCDPVGTELCNQTSGECVCKAGVMGLSCDLCAEGAYNFSSAGCEECGCDGVGSVGVDCDDIGQCTCKPGVTGLKCSECLPGYFAFSIDGCLPCNCSGRTNDCSLGSAVNGSSPQEICVCPDPYSGVSCEGCVDGYYLSASTGNCELCQCNERADTCAVGTGECMNCVDNTTGPSCERCSEGFYDNDPGADIDCMDCPCDLNTATNSSCLVSPSGDPVCYCLPGHSGSLCDSCEDGYFGSPLAFRCTSCDCNGNIDPDMPMSCDQDTGVCLLCINNSTGDECQFCDVGFFGDATIQDCQPCDCLEAGSDGVLCNRTTGECSCLEGVAGQSCDQCMPGFWNFTAGVGCEACDCGEGSTSVVCEPVTGLCPCAPGVGDNECSSCLDGYYNFTSQGCTDCDCDIGALNASCSSDGRCYCQPGVTGVKCNTCASFHTNLTSSGCVPCGECEQKVKGQLADALSDVMLAEQGLALFRGLYEADNDGCREINESLAQLDEGVAMTNDRLDNAEDRLDAVEDDISQVELTEQDILDKIARTLTYVNGNRSFAESTHDHITNVYNAMTDVLIDLGAVLRVLEPIRADIQQKASTAEMITEDLVNVSSMHNESYTDELQRAKALLGRVTTAREQLALYLQYAQIQHQQAINVSIKYQNVDEGTVELNAQAVEVQVLLNETLELIDTATAALERLQAEVAVVTGIVQYANLTQENADSAVNNIQIALMGIQNYIQELEALLGEEETNGEFDSGSGPMEPPLSGSGFGSGIGSGEPVPPSEGPVTTPLTIREGVALLRVSVDGLSRDVAECGGLLIEVADHVSNLTQTAQEINSTLTPSLTAGNSAVSAIIDYMETVSLIETAINVTADIQTTLQQVNSSIQSVEAEDFEAEIDSLAVNVQLHLSQAEQLRETVYNITIAVQNAASLVEADTNQTNRIAADAVYLRNRVMGLTVAASMFADSVAERTNYINAQLETVREDQDCVQESVEMLLANVTISNALLDQAQQLSSVTDDLITSSNASLLETQDYINNATALLSSIQSQSDANEQMLNSIAARVGDINSQLALAMNAAASIDIALNFNGNTNHTYSAPPTSTNTTTLLLAFRPAQVEYGTLLYTGSPGMGIGPDQEGLSLRLFNGSVQFGYEGVGVVSTEEGVVRENEWYQVYATRDADNAYLSVAPLQGGIPSYSSVTMVTMVVPPLIGSDDVIVLGGGQADVGPVAPNTDGYVGCIDRVVVNNEQLSLLLPNAGGPQPVVCRPRPPAEFPRTFESGVWLQGADSYLQLDPSSFSLEQGVSLTLSFRTFTADGTLLHLTSTSLVSHITVYLSGGLVTLEYTQTGLDSTVLQTSSSYNNGAWYGVSVTIDQQGAVLMVNETDVVPGGPTIVLPGAFNLTNFLFIGGVSPEVSAVVTVTRPSLPGCVRDVALNGQLLNLQQNEGSYRVSLGGCPAQVSTGVRFMGIGYGQFLLSGSQTLDSVGVEFRTAQLAASLLQLDTQPPVLVSLYHTRVRLDVGSYSFVSELTGLNDNRWHSLTLYLSNSTLIVDDQVYSLDPLQLTTPPTYLLVGGSPDPTSAVVGESLRGCVRNLQFNTMMLDFNGAQELVGVALYGCRPPSVTLPTPPPPPPLTPPPSTPPNIPVGLNGEQGAFIAVPLPPEEILLAHSIVVQFRTSSSDALLLYAQDVALTFADYLALELRSGRLYYSYNLGSGRVFISSNGTYHDGQLHTVEIMRAGQFGELIVDGGSEYVTGTSPGSFSHLNINSGLLFVGGVPSILDVTLTFPGQEDPLSATACFHSLSISGVYEDLSAPQAISGGTDCLDTYNNIATFSADSYLQILDNFEGGIQFSFSLRFRTTVCSGVLLYSHSLLFPDHIVLELVNGTVRFVFDNGPMEAVVEATPTSPSHLCDGAWHSLYVEKDGVRGVVRVDEGEELSVTSPFTAFRAVNINDPLYVGGTPSAVPRRATSLSGSFQGCISDLYLIQGDNEQRALLLSQATDGLGVSFNNCDL